jgi:hypothetical protein
VSKQLALWSYERPAQHGELLHSGERHGTVLLWQQALSKGAWRKIEPRDDLGAALSACAGQRDTYLSVNEFSGWRLVKQLRSLRALYVDLDEGLAGRRLEDWPSVVDEVQGLGLPRPSLVVRSGRGLHLYWRLEPLPSQTLPVWQACSRELVAQLKHLGADPAAADCTRVLRLVGTVNSRAGDAQVRGWVLDEMHWPLRELARHILPTREDTPDLRRGRGRVVSIESRRRSPAAQVAARTGPFQLWHRRYLALAAVADAAAFMRPSGVVEGNRDTLLFLLSNALAWFVQEDGLRDEISRIAKVWTPTLSSREVAEYTSCVVKRAGRAAAGEMVEFNGESRDPRYAFRDSTLRDWLGPLLTPELQALPIVREGLGLLSADEKSARRAERAARRRTGEYTGGGVKKSNLEKKALALDLAGQGMPLRDIAARVGAGKSAVHKWLSTKSLSV